MNIVTVEIHPIVYVSSPMFGVLKHLSLKRKTWLEQDLALPRLARRNFP